MEEERARGKRAIVVDDSSAIRAVLRGLLTQFGFSVAEAENGAVGLDLLKRSNPVQVALVDWNMPEMSGLEMLRAIRRDHDLDSMKVMMVTTETDLDKVRESLRCGADEYVMKPFDRDIIADKLRLLGF